MKTFIVYEIWTRTARIEANTVEEALSKHDPKPVAGMNLSNWHVAGETPTKS